LKRIFGRDGSSGSGAEVVNEPHSIGLQRNSRASRLSERQHQHCPSTAVAAGAAAAAAATAAAAAR